MEIIFKIPVEQELAFIREIRNAIKEEFVEILQVYKTEPANEDYLNRSEACKLLRCSLATLHNYLKKGKIPCLRIGRKVLFKKSELISSMQQTVKRNNYKEFHIKPGTKSIAA